MIKKTEYLPRETRIHFCEIDLHGFKQVPNWPNYFCSPIGQVYSYANLKAHKIMSNRRDKDGYFDLQLFKDGKGKFIRVHRIVAMTFIGPCPDGLVVNHKDGNKQNNNVENLEYVTVTENERHSRRVLGKTNKFKELEVIEIRKMAKNGSKYKEIMQAYPISHAQVSRIVNRKQWSHI